MSELGSYDFLFFFIILLLYFTNIQDIYGLVVIRVPTVTLNGNNVYQNFIIYSTLDCSHYDEYILKYINNCSYCYNVYMMNTIYAS